MIKIDFHIHTIKTDKDSNFTFSLKHLDYYVKTKKIDAIAITNHNTFDLTQFNLIKTKLDISVFPGIEIDLENFHILVISDYKNIVEFKNVADKVNDEYNKNGSIEIKWFKSIFEKYKNNFLFIPHYDKKPRISKEFLNELDDYIYCGEVSSFSKFTRLHKKENDLTPVIFSDSRMDDERKISSNQTYIDIHEREFSSIKLALKDKNKVFLNDKEKSDLFTICEDGTLASTGLNIIIGKRSSGKTFLLNTIYNDFNDNNVKYIKQFELIEKEEEKAKKDFDSKIKKKKSTFSEDYLKEFKKIVDKVNEIDKSELDTELNEFTRSLLEYALEAEKLDEYGKVPLFKEEEYFYENDIEIDQLIDAVSKLLDSNKYKQNIENFITRDTLLRLYNSFIEIKKEKQLESKIYENVNKIIKSLKETLEAKSSNTAVKSFDILNLGKSIIEIEYFEKLVKNIKTKDIQIENIGKFAIATKQRRIKNVNDLKNIFPGQTKFTDIFSLYDKPFKYLKKLSSIEKIEKSDIYKGFIGIDYLILNKYGNEVSGGERAEFNLEEKLRDANNYEMLLIDEPESSFDNIFLNEEITKKIKQLSANMPVFVSTHNNVVGISIKPDYILYTNVEEKVSKPIFKIYGGDHPIDSPLSNSRKSFRQS